MRLRSAKRKRAEETCYHDSSESESVTSGSSFKPSENDEDSDLGFAVIPKNNNGISEDTRKQRRKNSSKYKVKRVKAAGRSAIRDKVKKEFGHNSVGSSSLKKDVPEINNTEKSKSANKKVLGKNTSSELGAGVAISQSRNYDKQVIEQAIKRLKQGASIRAVSKELGVIRHTLYRWQNKYITENEQQYLREQRLSHYYENEIVQEICDLMKEGASTTFLAKQYKIDMSTIASWRYKFAPETIKSIKRISNDEKFKAIRPYLNGECVGKIAREKKISEKTIYEWSKKFLEKIQVTTPEGSWKYDEYTKLEACNRLKQGAKLETVAKELNIHISVLRKWAGVEDFGLTSQIQDEGKYNKELILSVCKRLQQGELGTSISRGLGINKKQIYLWKLKYCGSKAPEPSDTRKFDKKTIHRACELLRSGEKPIDVSKKLQINTSTILLWKRKYLKVKHKQPEHYSFATVLNLVKNFHYNKRKKIREIYELLSQGDSIKTVAEKLKMNLELAQEWRNDYIVKRDSVEDTSARADGIIQKVNQRFRQGTLLKIISKESGVNLKTVNYWHCKYLEKVSTKFLKKVNNIHNRRDVKLESLPIVILEKDPKLDQLCHSQNIINRYNDEMILQACRQLNKGDSVKSLSMKMGLKHCTLNNWKRRYLMGKVHETTPEGKWEYNRYSRLEAYHQINQGVAAETIAKELGVAVELVRLWKRWKGVTWLQRMDKMKRNGERERERRDEMNRIAKGRPYRKIFFNKQKYFQHSRKESTRQRRKSEIVIRNNDCARANNKFRRTKYPKSRRVFVPLRKIYIPNNMKLQFVNIIDDGASIEDISKELNINKLTVESWILNRDLLMRSSSTANEII